MTDSIASSRRLSPFPGPSTKENILTFDNWVKILRKPNAQGYLIYGGPGSGKSRLLLAAAEELRADTGALVVGPIGMKRHRTEQHADYVLADIGVELLKVGRERVPQIPEPKKFRDLLVGELMERISNGINLLAENGVKRLILMLDDFDDTHQWAALGFAYHLRRLHEEHKRYLDFVITAHTDFAELYTAMYSPWRNVVADLLLMDLNREETKRYANGRARSRFQLALTDADLTEIADETNGYPALINSVVELLGEARAKNESYTVADAVQAIVATNYFDREPFHVAIRDIERLLDSEKHPNSAEILQALAANTKNSAPPLDSRSTRTMLAMGMLGWHGKEHLIWRNPIVQKFWETGAGRKMLGGWSGRRPFLIKSTLRAQGTVLVSLLLDLGGLVESPDEFDKLRGSKKWMDKLESLATNFSNGENDAFRLWGDHHTLVNLGHDLNLFNKQIIEQSFTPIYEADMGELDLDFGSRLEKLDKYLPPAGQAQAKEALKQEQSHWDRVRVQLTRDGIAAVTLIRDITDAKPLMHILTDLLGLEREFAEEGQDQVDLSVQWELALAITRRFMRQSEPYLEKGLHWRERDVANKFSLYPDRDRYVIYRFRKLCDCHVEDRETKNIRRIITVGDLNPLRDRGTKPEDLAQINAYRYGIEIATLMEGVMVAKRKNGATEGDTTRFPPIKVEQVKRLLDEDISSWDNELFAISLDNALMLYKVNEKFSAPRKGGAAKIDDHCNVCDDYESQEFELIQFPQRDVPYEDYWRCLSLGLQYALELRWAARWVAKRTTRDLTEMSNQLSLKLDNRDPDEMKQLEDRLVLNSRLLSHLREATIPLYIASADYAVNKYEKFIEVSKIRETLQNGEKDIEAINNFLQHDKDQREDKRSQKRDSVFATAGIALALMAAFVALPSMWTDTTDVMVKVLGYAIPIGTEQPSGWLPNATWAQGAFIPLGYGLLVMIIFVGIPICIALWIVKSGEQKPSRRKKNKPPAA